MLDYQTVLAAYQAFYPNRNGPDFNSWWSSLENGNIQPATLTALVNLFQARPDQLEAFHQQGADVKGYLDGMVGFWNGQGGHAAANRIADYAPEMAVLDTLGFEPDPVALQQSATDTGIDPNGNTPAEEAIGRDLWNEYLRAREQDDTNRTNATSIVRDASAALDRATRINNEVFDHFDADYYLANSPDVAAWAQRSVLAGDFPDLATAAKYHYDNHGINEPRAVRTTNRLQQENENSRRVEAELLAGVERSAADKLSAIDARRAEMTTALAEMERDRSGALDAQVAQMRTALGALETERTAALGDLNKAREAAAQLQVKAVNLGLQGQQDRIAAEAAQQGFIGGSSMQDAALARAAIAAQNNAAQAVGSARVTNATDTRKLQDDMAGARFSLENFSAGERRGIADQGAGARLNLADTTSQARVGVRNERADNARTASAFGTQQRSNYFDADFGRRMQAALMPAGVATTRLNLMTLPNTVGSSGRRASLDMMFNYLGANSAPPSASAGPQVTPSQVGSDIAGFGANIAKWGVNNTDWSKVFGGGRGTPVDDGSNIV